MSEESLRPSGEEARRASSEPQEILAKLSKHASEAFSLASRLYNSVGAMSTELEHDLGAIKFDLACILSYAEKLKKQLGQGHAH